MVLDREHMGRSMLIGGVAGFIATSTAFLYGLIRPVDALLFVGVATVLIGAGGYVSQRFSAGPQREDVFTGVLNVVSAVVVMVTAFYDATTAAGIAISVFIALAAYYLLGGTGKRAA